MTIKLEVGKWYEDKIGHTWYCFGYNPIKYKDYTYALVDYHNHEIQFFNEDGIMLCEVDSYRITKEIPDPREESVVKENGTTDDGWIRWEGGACPVDGDTEVEVIFYARDRERGTAGGFDWGYNTDYGIGCPLDILMYRVVKESPKRFELKNMWIGWVCHEGTSKTYEPTTYFTSKADVLKCWDEKGLVAITRKELVAITRADATSFFVGEGLE